MSRTTPSTTSNINNKSKSNNNNNKRPSSQIGTTTTAFPSTTTKSITVTRMNKVNGQSSSLASTTSASNDTYTGPTQQQNGASNHQNDTSSTTSPKTNQYTVRLSMTFVLLSIVLVCSAAYIVGRISATFAVIKLSNILLLQNHQGLLSLNDNNNGDHDVSRALPPPIYSNKKGIPHTIYSSKHYDSGAISTTETLLARRAVSPDSNNDVDDSGSGATNQFIQHTAVPDHHHQGGGADVLHADGTIVTIQEDVYNETLMSELHEPSGHHLLVDIKSVNGKFLNSEEKLAQAMIDLVEMSGLTMLSYHCHRLNPVGVSCVGVLLESHISLHTWPIPGAICIDLFTCGPNSLLPILPAIERLFGVARIPAVLGKVIEKPFMQWAYKLRGFRKEAPGKASGDISHFLHGWLEFDMKEKVIAIDTPYQNIEIYDVINPRFNSLHYYKASISKNDEHSYEAAHPELFRPDRIVYLDGIMQSRYYGEAAYHEALVHPALFAHEHPKRVIIIGGGEGATLREVLKHNTIEKVTMIEIDEIMVNVSKQYLPEWSNCSMIVGSTPSCFDDPRAEVFYIDAISWIIDRFANKDNVNPDDRYDVIVMDALDPSSIVEFSDVLYGDDVFVRALSNALNDDGILVSQYGEDVKFNSAGAQVSPRITEHDFMTKLIENQFTKIEDYAEGHGGYLAVWKYKIAFKCIDCNYYLWHVNEAQVDLAIQKRILPVVPGTKSNSLLRWFDGATMMGYQFPSRVNENVFCRDVPTPEFCNEGHGFDPDIYNVKLTSLEVKESLIPLAGRGVFTKIDIPRGSYIGLEETTSNVVAPSTTTHWIRTFMNESITNRWKMFDAYLYGYGFSNDYDGETGFSIDNSLLQFLNHGCNGTNSIQNISVTEETASLDAMPVDLYNSYENTIYNPYISRNYLKYQNGGDPTNRDVKAGEELLDSYLAYYTLDTWERGIMDLRGQCQAQGLGSISSYEEQEGRK